MGHSAVERGATRALGALGAGVGRRPRAAAGLSLLAALVCSVGLMRLELVTESEKLWVPQNSEPQVHRRAVDDAFGATGSRFVQIYAPVKESGGNALSFEGIQEMFDAWEAVSAIEVGGKTYATGLCSQYDSPASCTPYGTLKLWGFDRSAFEAAAAKGGTALAEAWNKETFPDGAPLDPLSILGLPQRGDSNEIVGADTLMLTLALDSDDAVLSVEAWNEWNDKFFATMETLQGQNEVLHLTYWTPLSIDRELERMVNKDIGMFAAAIAIMTCFAVLVLTRFKRGGWVDMLRSRTQVGNIGVLSVLLSIAMGYGLACAFGISFTSLQMILPFILLGIGIDDCFVLIQGLDEVNAVHPGLSVEERMRKLMETAGISITVTSVTDFAAFMLGSISSLPAIRYFCLFAGIAIICDYFLQVTFFLAFLAINERQIGEGRSCLALCGLPTKVNGPRGAPLPVESLSSFERMGNVLQKTLCMTMSSTPAKALIVAFFAVLLSVSTYSITEMKEGLPLSDLVPDDSYVRDFFSTDDRTFRFQVGVKAGLYYLDPDQTSPAGQKAVLQALDDAKGLECVLDEQTGDLNWLSALHGIAGNQGRLQSDGTIAAADFLEILDGAEKLPDFAAFRSDYIRGSDGRILASVIRVVHKPEGVNYAQRRRCDTRELPPPPPQLTLSGAPPPPTHTSAHKGLPSGEPTRPRRARADADTPPPPPPPLPAA